MLFKYKILLLLFFIVTVGCKKEVPLQKTETFYKETITSQDRKVITAEEAKTYHTDKKHKYQYRTGNPGAYEYNYNLKGIDVKGDSVFGNINTSGKFGAGILIYNTIDEIEVKTEWVGHGKLKAIDNKGNVFQLIVN